MPSLDWATIWAVVAESLSQLGPNIRETSLRFDLNRSGDSTNGFQIRFGDGIEVLEPVFERDALSGVEDVQFGLYIDHLYRGDEVPKDPFTLEQMEDAIRVKLPKLHKRGIVHMRCRCFSDHITDSVSTSHRICESS